MRRSTELKGGSPRGEDTTEGLNIRKRRALEVFRPERLGSVKKQGLPWLLKGIIVGKGR